MGKFVDLTGQKFGRLTVIKRAENSGHHIRWYCNCDCGKENIIVYTDNLKRGLSTSCGCYQKDLAKEQIKQNRGKGVDHGMSDTRIYRIWRGIKERCYNSKISIYKWYGKKGVRVCNEWLDKENGFLSFYNWSIANGYRDNLEIDRINYNGNYEPLNCRWITRKEQMNNQSKNHLLTMNGETKTISQWAEEKQIDYDLLRGRVQQGFSEDKLFTPPRKAKNPTGEKFIYKNTYKKYDKFIVNICINNKKTNLGSYDTLEEAVKIRDLFIENINKKEDADIEKINLNLS